MIIQTKDLTGVALDWAVDYAVCGTIPHERCAKGIGEYQFWGSFTPSTDWSQCGPLIEQYKIDLYWHHEYQLDDETRPMWEACCENAQVVFADDYDPIGETALIASCRAIVAAKLGGSVDVPDELVGEAS